MIIIIGTPMSISNNFPTLHDRMVHYSVKINWLKLEGPLASTYCTHVNFNKKNIQ